MISESNYLQLKERFGNVASWAIWAPPGDTPKSNTNDLSVFSREDLLHTINTGFVFVGLNAASTRHQTVECWSNFHSGYSRQNDYKLRFALMGDETFWGSYITDIIKEYHEADSEKVVDLLRKNPAIVRKNMEIFEDEIKLLGEKPVLIALGNASYRILKTHLSEEYEIYKIPHYSARISKEKYREEVLNVLNAIPRK